MARRKKRNLLLLLFAGGIIVGVLFVSSRIVNLSATMVDSLSVNCVDKRGEQKTAIINAQNIKGNYYLPLRDVCLFYRLDFTYDPVEKVTTVKKDIRTVTVQPKQKKFIIGNKKVKIKQPVVLANNQMMFPAKGLSLFLTELLVNNVDWDESTKTLLVYGSGVGTDFWGNEVGSASDEKKRMIKSGDTLSISVWQGGSFELAELTRDREVEQDGIIKFPFIGRIKVVGLSPEQLEVKLTAQLSPYVKNPDVTVTIAGKPSYKVQIYGSVRNPGLYAFTDKATLMEAVNKAGGFTDDAKLAAVRVTRFVHHSPYVTETVNCKKILYDGERQYDVPVLENDIIFVPKSKSFFTGLLSFLERAFDFIIFRRIDRSSWVNG